MNWVFESSLSDQEREALKMGGNKHFAVDGKHIAPIFAGRAVGWRVVVKGVGEPIWEVSK